MTEAQSCKKRPEQVRIRLIENARRLALENGLAAVGVEMVAAHAGVTKGGLFHLFPSKQALVDAVCSLDRHAAIDGGFRAYCRRDTWAMLVIHHRMLGEDIPLSP